MLPHRKKNYSLHARMKFCKRFLLQSASWESVQKIIIKLLKKVKPKVNLMK